MAMQDTTWRMVITPLVVMLLLTVLMGLSSFQLSQRWDDAIGQLSGQMAEAVLLNNIRSELVQVVQYNPKNPALAQQSWEKAQDYLALLSPERRPPSLEDVLEGKQGMDNAPAMLEMEALRPNFDRIQMGLMEVQNYTRSVNLTMTFSMVILGFILMAITARDLNKLLVQLRASRDLNVTIQEEERHRLAQDLHDGVIQELVDLKRSYSPEKVDGVVDTIRRVCHNLRPQVLDDLGLAAALDFLADDLRHFGVNEVEVHLDRSELAKLPKRYELPIFRVVQELFSNIRQHASASQVKLTMVYHPDESPMLRAYITDNGVGYDPEKVRNSPKEARRGLGLTGITERVQQLGGRITMESSIGKGSQVQILIPVTTDETQPMSA